MYHCSCDRDEVVKKCGIAEKFETFHSSNSHSEYDKSTEKEGNLIKVLSFKTMNTNVEDVCF